MNELQIIYDGLPGQAMKIMRQRGWQIITSKMELTSGSLDDKDANIEVSCRAGFVKHGKPETKENWDKELLEVWKELNMNNIEKQLLDLGFRDVSYPQLKSQIRMFQLKTDETNLIVNLSFNNKIILSDGRATIEKIYYEGVIPMDITTLIQLYSKNLL